MADVLTVWSPFIITDKGLSMRQESIATGKRITFDYAKIGEGAPTNPANIPFMTDLVAPAEQVPVVRSESNGPTHFVGVRIDNKDFLNPVLMREISLFASLDGGEPTQYGYTYATQGYDSIPAGSVSHYVWTIGIDTIISRTQNISFNYDGSSVYATLEDFNMVLETLESWKDDQKRQDDELAHLISILGLDERGRFVIDGSEPIPSENANVGMLTQLMGRLAYMIKQLSGNSAWWQTPSSNIEDLLRDFQQLAEQVNNNNGAQDDNNNDNNNGNNDNNNNNNMSDATLGGSYFGATYLTGVLPSA